jgi:NodT family efflux transporter outer membrane factor (OMF) lipoprotein
MRVTQLLISLNGTSPMKSLPMQLAERQSMKSLPMQLAACALVLGLLGGCADMRGLAPAESLRDANSLQASRSLAGANISPAAWPATDWWRAFGDAQLDTLMQEALAGSPTLGVAAARTRKALAAANASEASLYPRIDAGASSTRERFSANGLTPPPYGGSWQTLDQLQVTLAWEIDFWGKHRDAYAAALGAARAAEVDAFAARLALTTDIGQAYVQLQRAFVQRDVADATLRDREQVLALTRDRNNAGLDSKVELKQAESALPATREAIAQIDERIAVLRNQMAALVGAGPDRGLAIARPSAAALTRIALPAVLPADLLGRRPDLTAQRWRVEAAAKDIASAKAAFYPNVNLLAFVGLQSLAGGNLLTAASRMAGAGPALTLPIFEGGRLRADLAGKDADYDVAVGQYNQALADAMRDVVDQLAAFRSVDAQRAQQAEALQTAREAYELSLLRYREGLGNYLQVLSAEQPMLAQQSLDADLDARELEVSINLVRALGGGFQPTPTENVSTGGGVEPMPPVAALADRTPEPPRKAPSP